MSREEIMDAFCYFYRDLERSHLTEGKVDTNNSEELSVINAGIATALTINKIFEEEM